LIGLLPSIATQVLSVSLITTVASANPLPLLKRRRLLPEGRRSKCCQQSLIPTPFAETAFQNVSSIDKVIYLVFYLAKTAA
jgi:hypothetical protein